MSGANARSSPGTCRRRRRSSSSTAPALGVRESRRVLHLIRRLRDDGHAVIVVSHAMDHVIEVADRAVVMRRGRNVGEEKPGPDSQQRIVALIIGTSSEPPFNT